MPIAPSSADALTPPSSWPDFDWHPVSHRLTAAAPDARSVRATWSDGLECRYHVDWLRENAPDADTTHPVTREQALQLVEIPADLEAVEARVAEDGGLVVRWSTGDESRFHPGWLRAYSFGAEDPFRPAERRLWAAGDAAVLPRFDGPAVLADEAHADDWAEALHVYGVAILENLPPEPEMIERAALRLGPIRETNFGRWFDVRTKADATSNAYTSMTLPVHTDLCTREYAPGLQFLFALENGAVGGESLLADGFEIAQRLRAEDPEAFEALTTIPVGFYNKATSTDFRWETPMIGLDAEGEVAEIRWSPWLRTPVKASFEQVDRLYRGLRRVFTLGETGQVSVKVKLRAGELLSFDNRRVLHGRAGFDPTTGSRWLRGCYVDREDLMSRLRMKGRRARQSTMTG